MRPSLILRRGLAFPGGKFQPGFDPTHVAASGISSGNGISVISLGGTKMINLLNGQGPNTYTADSGNILSVLGPSTYFNTQGNTFTGQASNGLTGITYAAIVQFTAVAGAYQTIIQCSSNIFGLNADTTVAFYLASGEASSGITPVANTPYFIAASVYNNAANSAICAFLVMNLRTGKIQTASVTSTNNLIASANGTVAVGNNGNIQFTQGYMAAAMYAPAVVSLSAMLQWAADPWGFWYPSNFIDEVSGIGILVRGPSAAPAGVISTGMIVYP